MSTEKNEQLMTLRDRETQQLIGHELAQEFKRLANDMGLDLRLGHLLPMGGAPYLTHEGLKYLLQSEKGPGIKSCRYIWVHDEWANQYFVAKCILETSRGTYEGEGDAVGVPVQTLQGYYDDATSKGWRHKERRKYVMDNVADYPLKNVTSHLAMDLAARRMAQTRAFNRAARIALTLALPTVEERYIDIGTDAIEGNDVVTLATNEQVAKIREFAKSKKEGIVDLVLQYGEKHGKPELWTIEVASSFIDEAIAIVDEAKKEKKVTKIEF